MTALTVVLTPWYRRGDAVVASGESEEGSVSPTRILDHESAEIRQLVDRARRGTVSDDALYILQSAHAIIRDEVRPVYALNELASASCVFRRRQGSCSQRLAILESVARALGVPTRARALQIDRSFWYPRFPRISWVLPDTIMLIWPEFEIAGSWKSAAELFGPIGCHGGGPFSNTGAETLFEAVGRCAIDWDGRNTGDDYDLSRFVRADRGYFEDRDSAFELLGQTLSPPFRILADPILRRVRAS